MDKIVTAMNEQGFLELLCHTTDEEKIKRFDEISRRFHHKYFSLVWYARSDEQKMVDEERYEGLAMIKKVKYEFPEEVKELQECDSNWQHGFNSGMLACIRFLESYMKDDLWPIEDTGGVEWGYEDIHIINGKEYVLMDGRASAEDLFPELDT
jgi:hypothetical protein